jgi:hypothetical protein
MMHESMAFGHDLILFAKANGVYKQGLLPLWTPMDWA